MIPTLNEQQNMLRTMTRQFLSAECSKVKIREMEKGELDNDEDLWKRLAELGLIGLLIPDEYKGDAADFMDMVVVMEEVGRNILPCPFFATIAMGALPIIDFGTKNQKQQYLPPIARGENIWTMAINEETGDGDFTDIRSCAKLTDGGYVLNGEKTLVPYANIADYMVVLASTLTTKRPQSGLTLFIVNMKNPGITIEVVPTITGETLCQVRFEDVDLCDNDILGMIGNAENTIEQILNKATLLKCAEVSGACQAVLEMTKTYAKDRHQFGKPIGVFQVIQHKLVDMLIHVEGLQYLVYQAAYLVSKGANCSTEIAMAKLKANEIYQIVCIDGIKIHGAIGFSMEHDIGLYYRRVLSSRFTPYTNKYYLEKVAAGIGL